MSTVVAFILARGGSKGIPGKNIKNFCGKPLISWSIIQALGTPEIDEVYVTSDSDDILQTAKNYGCREIKRPDEISGDHSKSESAVLHALENIDSQPEIVVMLEPTAPLRQPYDLSRAIRQFRLENWDSGFSGAMLEGFLIWEKASNGILEGVNHDFTNQIPRQDRNTNYVENGAIYLFKPNIIVDEGCRFGGKIGVYLMDYWQTFELDVPDDWELCELIFNNYLKSVYATV